MTTMTSPTMSSTTSRSAVLDDMHLGDIKGALGTIRLDDNEPRSGMSRAWPTPVTAPRRSTISWLT